MTAIVFDIETHSSKELYALPPEQFFRIGGAGDLVPDGYDDEVTDDYGVFRDHVADAPLVAGHNIFAFDLPALGIKDLLERAKARKIIDTWALAVVMDPPPDSYQPREGARRFPKKPEDYKSYYALDNLAFQYGVEGKSHSLKDLAAIYGDPDECCAFGTIPTDNAEYNWYLKADVAASRTILGTMLARFGQLTDYHWREMEVAAVMSTVSTNGFRLDQELTRQRIASNAETMDQGKQWLVENFDLPTTTKDGKREAKNPVATEDGKRAVLEALYANGVQVADIPRTPKGAPSLGSDGLKAIAKKYENNQNVQAICTVVGSMQGLRTVYQTALDNVHADGFCHPDIFALQASGRLSTQDPGLTVFGKRGGKVVEREIFHGDLTYEEVGPDDMHVVFAADFAQIDARAVAALSQDHVYLSMFEPGVDIHAENAKAAYGQQAYDLDPKGTRQAAKVVGHGWNYNMGLDKLALTVGDRAKAEAFDLMMRTRYQRLIQWKLEMVEQARTGRMDNGFGRWMKTNPDRAYTQGPALMGQGAARDLMFEAILRMDPAVVRMIKALVHDEIVFSAPVRYALEVRQHAIECMTFDWAPPGASRPVHIEADASGFGTNWAAAYAA